MLKDKKIGFALTGSFYNYKNLLPIIQELIDLGAKVIPIMSFNSFKVKTKTINLKEIILEIERICSNKIITTIEKAEKVGKKRLTDIIVVAPCTGNTLAKLAYGISDNPVTTAIKYHIKNTNNVVLAISAPDALSSNAKNIGDLLNRKHFYFVPFRQDNPITKPYSLSFDSKYILPCIEKALVNEQIQPILL